MDEKITSSFIKAVELFVPRQDYNDLIWDFYLKINRIWHFLYVQKYQKTYYFGGSSIESGEIAPKENKKSLPDGNQLELIKKYTDELLNVYKQVKDDSVGYHKKLFRMVSPNRRKGIIHRKFVNILIPDYCRFDKELSKKEIKDIVELIKSYPDDEPIDNFTAGLYFKYCKIAYSANPATFDNKISLNQPGRELYKRWADGRDGGLSDLKADDRKAFEKWYSIGAALGGHPWEIYRGGNSTHISLSVYKHQYKEGFEVHLTAFSSTRLVETCRIALALKKAGLKFTLDHKESYLKRLLREDYIGIQPERHDIKYGWHAFPKEFNVADCIYYSWFKDDSGKALKPMREIRQLITWFPITPLFISA